MPDKEALFRIKVIEVGLLFYYYIRCIENCTIYAEKFENLKENIKYIKMLRVLIKSELI
ncbi:hypothetical protein [Acidilutibacter cellobiosedens]|uniref:hypothetical protein n=1 Tax=Acidilutibacter cellobiosedens TaxID=2507161 RepID=UPI001375F2FF|nr:hypothetical protein [Acidilutibacter cellobiosedens]